MTGFNGVRFTSREIRANWQRLHDIVIPCGTRAYSVLCGGGVYQWYVQPHNVVLQSETRALFNHDSTYHYIWVSDSDLRE